MPTPVLTLNHNSKSNNPFSWNLRRGKNIVASAAKYNRKQSMKKVLKNTVFQGWIFDWKAGTAILVLAGGKTKKMLLVDNCQKKSNA